MQEGKYHIGSIFLAASAVLALALYGLFFIYSTGYIGDDFPVRENWTRQTVFFVIGAVLAVLVARWDYRSRSWFFFVCGGYAISLLLLVVVLFLGQRIGGARRWLNLGFMTLQPAEFAKLFAIMLCAWLVGTGKSWLKSAGCCFLLVIPPAFLILLEPSYGNAFSLFPAIAALYLLRWTSRRFIALLFALLFLGICLFTAGITWLRSDAGTPYVERITTSPALNSIGLRDYHIKRIHNYLTPRGEWNERQSIVTIASGGPYGKGYLQGTMKNLGFLPRTVAPTDFIFAVICEEMGFLFGCLPVVGLYALLLAITLHWSACAEDKTGSALCNGLSMLLFTHIAINLAMTTRLIPIMGLPLPLLSYGGSYLLATLLALGTMASIPLHTGNREAPSTSGENTISIFNFFVIRLR